MAALGSENLAPGDKVGPPARGLDQEKLNA